MICSDNKEVTAVTMLRLECKHQNENSHSSAEANGNITLFATGSCIHLARIGP